MPAGVLFFYKKPRSILNHAEILFTKFSGTNMDKVVRTHDYSSPLVQMANKVITDLQKEFESSLTLQGASLLATDFIIPLEALREALNNALIHRKYFVKDAIKIQKALIILMNGQITYQFLKSILKTKYSSP